MWKVNSLHWVAFGSSMILHLAKHPVEDNWQEFWGLRKALGNVYYLSLKISEKFLTNILIPAAHIVTQLFWTLLRDQLFWTGRYIIIIIWTAIGIISSGYHFFFLGWWTSLPACPPLAPTQTSIYDTQAAPIIYFFSSLAVSLFFSSFPPSFLAPFSFLASFFFFSSSSSASPGSGSWKRRLATGTLGIYGENVREKGQAWTGIKI